MRVASAGRAPRDGISHLQSLSLATLCGLSGCSFFCHSHIFSICDCDLPWSELMQESQKQRIFVKLARNLVGLLAFTLAIARH